MTTVDPGGGHKFQICMNSVKKDVVAPQHLIALLHSSPTQQLADSRCRGPPSAACAGLCIGTCADTCIPHFCITVVTHPAEP